MDRFTSQGASFEPQQSISSDLPASIELTPFDLLERELADESPVGNLHVIHSLALHSTQSFLHRSLCEGIVGFTSTPLSSGAALSVFSEQHVSALTDRLRSRIAELMEVFPDADVESSPTADPQTVDAGWLDEIQSIRSREAGDLAAWYASMDEE